MAERCVDASVAVKWVVVGEAWRKKARQFLADSITANVDLIAPPLFAYETESAIQGLLHRGSLDPGQADTALARLDAVGVHLVSHPDLVKRAREIARRFNQYNIYDSLYAALADLRSCEFWTADKAYYNAVKTGLLFVKYLPDYP